MKTLVIRQVLAIILATVLLGDMTLAAVAAPGGDSRPAVSDAVRRNDSDDDDLSGGLDERNALGGPYSGSPPSGSPPPPPDSPPPPPDSPPPPPDSPPPPPDSPPPPPDSPPPPTTPSPSCSPAASGLVAWWPGDGNANDISGSGLTGILQGNASFEPAKIRQGFLLAAGDFVEVQDPSNLLNIVGPFTIDSWVRLDSGGGSSPIVHRSGDGSGFELGVREDGRVEMVVRDEDGVVTRAISDVPIPLGTFVYVAGGFDGTNVFLYINGVPQAISEASNHPGSTDGASVFIGRNLDDTSRFFPGVIDQVQIFSRALSPAEIAATFDADSAGKCKEAVEGVEDVPVALNVAVALAILQYIAGLEDLEFPENLDVNGDGTINILDALAVLGIVVSAP